MTVQEFTQNPTLQTVLMIEKAAEQYSEECGKYQLWKRLPRKVMYQTFLVVLTYLEASNKILIDSDGKVVWIWNPRLIRKLEREGVIRR